MLAESWRRIIAWHDRYARPGYLQFSAGIDDADIDAFESRLGVTLPADIRRSWTSYNGGRDVWLPGRGEVLSFARVIEQWEAYKAWQEQEDFGLGPDWECTRLRGPIRSCWWTPLRIPLTDSGSGDHAVLDLDPPADGVYGQVIRHDHEVGPTHVLAAGWADFLGYVADELDRGKFVYLADGDAVVSREIAGRERG